jgi:hypothetical protein
MFFDILIFRFLRGFDSKPFKLCLQNDTCKVRKLFQAKHNGKLFGCFDIINNRYIFRH